MRCAWLVFQIGLTIGLASCTSQPPGANQPHLNMPVENHAASNPAPANSFRELNSDNSGVTPMRNILISSSMSKQELVALAKRLHKENPTTVFSFYDGDHDFDKIKDAIAGKGPKPTREMEDWLVKHDIAIVVKFRIPAATKWQLVGGYSGKYSEWDSVIADLE